MDGCKRLLCVERTADVAGGAAYREENGRSVAGKSVRDGIGKGKRAGSRTIGTRLFTCSDRRKNPSRSRQARNF